MPWVSQKLWTVGETVTAGQMNTYLRDDSSHLRTMTGNADPPAAGYVVVSTSTTMTAWSLLNAGMLASPITTALVLDNNIAVTGENTSNVPQNLAKVDTSNRVVLGAAARTLLVEAAATTFNGGAVDFNSSVTIAGALAVNGGHLTMGSLRQLRFQPEQAQKIDLDGGVYTIGTSTGGVVYFQSTDHFEWRNGSTVRMKLTGGGSPVLSVGGVNITPGGGSGGDAATLDGYDSSAFLQKSGGVMSGKLETSIDGSVGSPAFALNGGGIGFWRRNSSEIGIAVGSGLMGGYIAGNAQWGVGPSPPATGDRMVIDGGVRATSAYSTSTERLKVDIRDFILTDPVRQALRQLQPRQFHRLENEVTEPDADGQRAVVQVRSAHEMLGLITEQVPPELRALILSPDGEAVDLYAFITLAMAQATEAHARLDALEAAA